MQVNEFYCSFIVTYSALYSYVLILKDKSLLAAIVILLIVIYFMRSELIFCHFVFRLPSKNIIYVHPFTRGFPLLNDIMLYVNGSPEGAGRLVEGHS